ncbi:MAG TPA: FAD-binding oxidoreductase [Xanthobacteraceae bacterium]|nr:FAD-binding oxidoreductase [Xanthobacteraceae bacterium]
MIVIGAGTVGAAIAYGLARKGLRVTVLDGPDTDFRAARANFGLVWVQGKGQGKQQPMPAYQALSRRSSDLWPGFNAELTDLVGHDLGYERNGGLAFCLGEAELATRRAALQRLHNALGGDADWEMLDRPALEKLLPRIRLGPDVTGASFGRSDGHVNPLRLLAALHEALLRLGGALHAGHAVRKITGGSGGVRVETDAGCHAAARLVIAAGLGSAELARQVDLTIPLRPQRGQILVTERFAPFLPLPASGVRQTREGTVMIGATQEEVGFDTSTTVAAAAKLSARALRIVPALKSARIVRHWAGLRVMTPDSYPVYAQSTTRPGAFVALCHSGVTLAALHATVIADAVAAGSLPASLAMFHQGRFDVPQAA